jgi:hypothetical protein
VTGKRNVIDRATAPDPGERYQEVGSLLAAWLTS